MAALSQRLNQQQTQALVREAEGVADTVVLVEIDPREGSGIVPREWLAFLQPEGAAREEPAGVPGTVVPELAKLPALAGVFRRDFNYDAFWVTFPLTLSDGKALFPNEVNSAELVVEIFNKRGSVTWPIPESVRTRMARSPINGQS
jgi:hypothetical protein